MAGFVVGTNANLIRSSLWSRDLKRVLLDDLMAMKYVRMITDFPDGTTINIPSIGLAEVGDFAEGEAVRYTAFDTGNFQFTIGKYKFSATYMSEQFKQDSFYAQDVINAFVPEQHRAIAVAMETDILATAPSGQTASNSNTINNAKHRFVGSGTNAVITLNDFAKARHALFKAHVPMTNLTAIVDPTVAYQLATQTNMVNLLSPVQKWTSIISDGYISGMQFVGNVYGFDVYVSNYLKNVGAETIDAVSTDSSGVANLFFAATGDMANPFIGLVRQPPKVDTEFNKDLQREEYMTTCRYDFALFRPENMVCVLTNTNHVYS